MKEEKKYWFYNYYIAFSMSEVSIIFEAKKDI